MRNKKTTQIFDTLNKQFEPVSSNILDALQDEMLESNLHWYNSQGETLLREFVRTMLDEKIFKLTEKR